MDIPGRRKRLFGEWFKGCIERHAALPEVFEVVRFPKRRIVPGANILQTRVLRPMQQAPFAQNGTRKRCL